MAEQPLCRIDHCKFRATNTCGVCHATICLSHQRKFLVSETQYPAGKDMFSAFVFSTKHEWERMMCVNCYDKPSRRNSTSNDVGCWLLFFIFLLLLLFVLGVLLNSNGPLLRHFVAQY